MKFRVLSVFNLQAKTIPPTECVAPCVNGECKESQCFCKGGYFGRVCDKQIYSMGSDTFSTTVTLEAYEAIYFEEDFSSGEDKISFELKSTDKPLMNVIVNEQNSNDYTTFMGRDPNLATSKF